MTRAWLYGLRFLLVAMLAGIALTGAGVVSADNGSGAQASPDAQGMDALMPAPKGLQGENQPTMSEKYPVTAYTPFQVDNTVPLTNPGSAFWSYMATGVASALLVVAMMVLRLTEWIFTIDIIGAAAPVTDNVVGHLVLQVYRPALAGVYILLGIWFTWRHLWKAQWNALLERLAWVGAVSVLAAIYFAQPGTALTVANGYSASVSRLVFGAIATVNPNVGPGSSDPRFNKGDATNAELRAAADDYWQTYVFLPWSIAALGGEDTAKACGELLLAKNAGMGAGPFDDCLSHAPQKDKDWYQGQRGWDRFSTSAGALFVASLSGGLMLLISSSIVLSQVSLVFIAMGAPLILLAGAFPGRGRRFMVSWLDKAGSALLKRIAASFLLGLVLLASTIVGKTFPWAVAAFLQIVIIVAAAMKWHWLWSSFRSWTQPSRIVERVIPQQERVKLARRWVDPSSPAMRKHRRAFGKAANGTLTGATERVARRVERGQSTRVPTVAPGGGLAGTTVHQPASAAHLAAAEVIREAGQAAGASIQRSGNQAGATIRDAGRQAGLAVAGTVAKKVAVMGVAAVAGPETIPVTEGVLRVGSGAVKAVKRRRAGAPAPPAPVTRVPR
jgi:hypothetical protein